MAARQSHTDLPPEALALVAERFRVLAEPLRLQILQLLRNGEKNISELTELLGTTQPNASKHVRILQEAGLVGRRQAGNAIYCFVSDDSVFALCDLVCTSLYERVSTQARILESPRRRRR